MRSLFYDCRGGNLFYLETPELVEGYIGWPTMPTMTFDECPDDLDVLVTGMVPPEVIEDPEVIRFSRGQGKSKICDWHLLRFADAGYSRITERQKGNQ